MWMLFLLRQCLEQIWFWIRLALFPSSPFFLKHLTLKEVFEQFFRLRLLFRGHGNKNVILRYIYNYIKVYLNFNIYLIWRNGGLDHLRLIERVNAFSWPFKRWASLWHVSDYIFFDWFQLFFVGLDFTLLGSFSSFFIFSLPVFYSHFEPSYFDDQFNGEVDLLFMGYPVYVND